MVTIASTDRDRCGYQPGELRCIRTPHPDQPNAHIRVAAAYECEQAVEEDA